jgi:hypothetical protein
VQRLEDRVGTRCSRRFCQLKRHLLTV